ncbi:hypothetical protein ECANGB1_1695 [Enterospora canceri]|uniref:Spt6 SH2 domain-containing protein n=1 Tax=Enterospora canceri TaxID=1081671 RepID=A0A1Y1S958_9MICR|nr:hypothetical protein ECANGB1_1695 [Enterospora canceri]
MNRVSCSSSEEEIIKRSRKIKVKEESESSLVEGGDYEYDQIDPLFYEIFGAGNEYNYIYEKEETEKEETEKEKAEELIVDEFECCEYVRKYIENADRNAVACLLRGEALEFVCFHMDACTITDGLNILRFVNEYKEYCRMRREERFKNASQYDTSRALKMYNKKIEDIDINGLLKVSHFIENMRVSERLYEPEGNLAESFYKSNEYTDAANQLGNHPVFVEHVHRFYEKALLDYVTAHGNEKSIERIKEGVLCDIRDIHLPMLEKLYMSDTDEVGNGIRRKLFRAAYDKINMDYFNTVFRNLQKTGQIYSKNGIEELTNMLISLKGRPGEYYGLYCDRSTVYIVKVDEFSNIVDKRVFKSQAQRAEICNYLETASNVVVASNTTNVRWIVEAIRCPCYYLPKSFSYFKENKEFSIPYNIACAVQNPSLYFSRCINEGVKVELANSFVETDVLRQAITVSTATDKLDFKGTLDSPFGYTFFKLIGVSLVGIEFDFKKIRELRNLEIDSFTPEEVNRIFTFFKVTDSPNKLDHYNIHPRNYSLFNVISSCLADIRGNKQNQEEMIDYMLNNLNEVYSLDFLNVNYPSTYIHPMSGMGMLVKRDHYFGGVNDKMVFEDIIPQNIVDRPSTEIGVLGESTGVVLIKNDDWCIVDVHGVRVFVGRCDPVEVNQIVTVCLTEPTYSQLTYRGELVPNQAKEVEFKKHRLFVDYPNNEMPIFIRQSRSSEYFCNVALRVERGLYFQYRMEEVERNNEIFYVMKRPEKEYTFDNLDVFIEGYLKPMNRYVHKLTTFKYFKTSQAEAEEYVEAAGDRYRRYACYFDRESPGHVTMLFAEFRLTLRVELNFMVYKKILFGSLEEFSNYCKKMHPKL